MLNYSVAELRLKTKLQIHSFYKIYRIETQCPDGSNDVIRNYIK